MKVTEELLNRLNRLQEEMHDMQNQLHDELPERAGKTMYQDLVTAYLLLKIADLEERIEKNK